MPVIVLLFETGRNQTASAATAAATTAAAAAPADMIRTSYFGATSKAVSQSRRTTATATTAATARHGNNTGGPMAYNAIVVAVMVETIRLFSLIVRLDIGDSAKQSTGGTGGGGLTEKWYYRFPYMIFAEIETPGAFKQTRLLA